MDLNIELNTSQLISFLEDSPIEVDIEGRGTGKSFSVSRVVDRNVRLMPRGITTITQKTYGQALTRTLPSTFKALEMLGYYKDIHYVVRQKPPASFHTPLEKILSHENTITFSNGHTLLLLSQDRAGANRGPNIDFEIVDEALTIDKEKYNAEVSPTNRANSEIFGKKSLNPLPFHNGFLFTSSMPPTREGQWLLNFANYYEEEKKINLFQIWNRIVKLQLELLKTDDPKVFQQIWNETMRLRKQIIPFQSKDQVLFKLANAFDNIRFLGLSYLKREYKKLPLFIFLVEMMNMFIDKVQGCYYQISDQKHIYYGAVNSSHILDIAENTRNDFNELEKTDCRHDSDRLTNQALEIVFDWGAAISLMSVSQELPFDPVTLEKVPTDCTINEFFTKADDESENTMIDELIDKFCNYYYYHSEKTVYYYKDRHGDKRLANSKTTYNQQAMSRLEKKGWTVIPVVHRREEPPQHDKYLMWMYILKETNPAYPRWRINGLRCKYTVISMSNTQVMEREGKFCKNKKSEHPNSGILPEEATHFGDAVDKKMWTKYIDILDKGSSDFIEPRWR